jgi:hypothetical protein
VVVLSCCVMGAAAGRQIPCSDESRSGISSRILCFSVQLLAAASELAIPHFTSATIFAVAKQGNSEGFHANIRLLAVSAFPLPHTQVP